MANPTVALDTNHGTIVLELFQAEAPKTVQNFLDYVAAGFYDGTLFHRVIPNFMIQGGGFDTQERQKPTRAQVANEADNGVTNQRGTIAMARTGDPHSATAQFFINLKDNGFLNHTGKNPQGWGYTVFGKVVEGMDVVDKIAKVSTSRGSISEAVPAEAVIIQKASSRPATA
jgi:cyclophilin family peptidyl-prolyl cis-trans isomerase